MELMIEAEQEVDGRWLAEVMDIPGALAYGTTHDEAVARVRVLAFGIVSDRLANGNTREADDR